MDEPRASSKLETYLRLARLVLGVERTVALLWKPALLVLTFVAFALLGVFEAVGEISRGWGHLALLLLFGGALLYLLRHAVRGIAPGDPDAAARRLERDSTLAHRPLSALSDNLAIGDTDPLTRSLWRAHLQKQLAALKTMRLAGPDPQMVSLDRFAVRSAVVLLFVVGLVTAWPNPEARLAMAFQPHLKPLVDSPKPTLDVWVTPPAYTGQPPLVLAQARVEKSEGEVEEPQTYAVPIGSKLLAKVNGGEGVPSLLIDQDARAFEAVDATSHQVELTLDQGSELSILQSESLLGSWQINILPDLKPAIELVEEPSTTERSTLVLHYQASDDYGLEAAGASIRLVGKDGQVTGHEPTELPLTLPGIGVEAADLRDYHDLTPHPWAGLEVELTLSATDEAGQSGTSKPTRMILPERVFNHPVARAVIEQRKRLVSELHEKRDIANILASLAARPQHYYDDFVTFLTLRTAAMRLALGDATEELAQEVQQLLWDTALRIEDGELSLAANELRDLERKILELLAQEEVDPAQLEALMDELKQAIDKYLQAMLEQMQQQDQQNPQQGEQQPIDPSQMLERQDLMDMVERARDLMKSGSKDQAREMLSKLRELMENLQAGRPQPMSREQQTAREMMKRLQELAEQQQKLLDQTYKMNQDGNHAQGRDRQQAGQMPNQPQNGAQQRGQQQQRNNQPGSQSGQAQPSLRGQGNQDGRQKGTKGLQGLESLSPSDMAELQDQLRRQLGDFMRQLSEEMGGIPQELGDAERSMKDAANALGQSQPGEAIGPQGDALEKLQDGAQSMLNSMRQNQMAGGGQTADRNARGTADGRNQRDPLNRNQDGRGNYDRKNVGVPLESDVQRARRIFDELRRRSGDRSRPALELDYIDRLLKRF